MKRKYKTAEDLREAIDEFFANPPMTTAHFKSDVYEVPYITSQSLAHGLGYASRQSLHDLASLGDDWAEAIEYAKARIKSYYEIMLQHGNGAGAAYMLGAMGERPVNAVELSGRDGGAIENNWTVEFVNAETKD